MCLPRFLLFFLQLLTQISLFGSAESLPPSLPGVPSSLPPLPHSGLRPIPWALSPASRSAFPSLKPSPSCCHPHPCILEVFPAQTSETKLVIMAFRAVRLEQLPAALWSGLKLIFPFTDHPPAKESYVLSSGPTRSFPASVLLHLLGPLPCVYPWTFIFPSLS